MPPDFGYFSGGVIYGVQAEGDIAFRWVLEAKGYQWEAESVGIEEQLQANVNAGKFINMLRQKWTTLGNGEIDVTNSPMIDFIRIQNYRRFADICREIAQIWPGSEFFIKNTHTSGEVYFRQAVTEAAPIVLNNAFIKKIGAERGEQGLSISTDYEKVYNIVRYPFYQERYRDPDYAVQSTVADDALLRSTVTLSGQPAFLEEAQLLFDDFSGDVLNVDFVEDDLTNSNPPLDFLAADGYLLQGKVNEVDGLHFLDTSAHSPAVKFGDIGRITDVSISEPWTGEERQIIYCQELVVNALGDAIIGGIIDNSTVTTTALSGSTTGAINVASTTGFVAGDRLEISSQKTYITSVGSGVLNVSPSLSGAPGAGVTVASTA